MRYENENNSDFSEENLPFMEGKPFSDDFIVDDEEIAKMEEEYYSTIERWIAWGW